MKKTVITGTVCDNPHQHEIAAASTRTITLNGRTYQIDLCGPCTIGFDTALGVITKHARIVTRKKATPVTKRRGRAEREADKAVRNFWRDNPDIHDGPFQERGRIPGDVTAAYRVSKAA